MPCRKLLLVHHVRLPVLVKPIQIFIHAVVIRKGNDVEVSIVGVNDIIAEIDRLPCTLPCGIPKIHLDSLGQHRGLARH